MRSETARSNYGYASDAVEHDAFAASCRTAAGAATTASTTTAYLSDPISAAIGAAAIAAGSHCSVADGSTAGDDVGSPAADTVATTVADEPIAANSCPDEPADAATTAAADSATSSAAAAATTTGATADCTRCCGATTATSSTEPSSTVGATATDFAYGTSSTWTNATAIAIGTAAVSIDTTAATAGTASSAARCDLRYTAGAINDSTYAVAATPHATSASRYNAAKCCADPVSDSSAVASCAVVAESSGSVSDAKSDRPGAVRASERSADIHGQSDDRYGSTATSSIRACAKFTNSTSAVSSRK